LIREKKILNDNSLKKIIYIIKTKKKKKKKKKKKTILVFFQKFKEFSIKFKVINKI